VDNRCGTDNSVGNGTRDSFNDGWIIHILLVIAIVVVLIRIIQGQKIV